MTSFQIKEVKKFMGQLLTMDTFDSFLLNEASIAMNTTIHIDGYQVKDFYTVEEWADETIRPYDYVAWKEIRPLCFQLIKGRKTPAGFKFILHLMPPYVEKTLLAGDTEVTADMVKALILNIKYDGTTLTCVTATAFHTFVMDKTLDALWDKTMRQFFIKKDIDFDEL